MKTMKEVCQTAEISISLTLTGEETGALLLWLASADTREVCPDFRRRINGIYNAIKTQAKGA